MLLGAASTWGVAHLAYAADFQACEQDMAVNECTTVQLCQQLGLPTHCGTPTLPLACVENQDWNCFSQADQSCGLKYQCGTANLAGGICKRVNKCYDMARP